MDLAQFATNFGLPGFLIVVWFLLQSKRDERTDQNEKAKIASNEKVELERIKVEDKKADTMAAALTSLSGKIDAHHTLDIQSHAQLSADLAGIDSKLDTALHLTPVRGVPRIGGERKPSRGEFHDGEDDE